MSLIPKNLFYSNEHEWIKIDGDNCVIGITDFAQEQLTDIVYLEIPEVGTPLEKDEAFGVVESVKSVSDIYSPLSGEIISINEDVIEAPELINEDPYGDGWLIKIKIDDESELDSLMDAMEYQDYIESGE